MKERILFVGADQPLWREFQSQDSAALGGWTAQFAHTRPEALACIERETFAAIVADFNLSDGSGLDLLDEVLTRQPKSCRIVLSDCADARTTIQCLGRGHNHLPKPCNVPKLITTLDKSSAVEAWLPRAEVQAMVARLRRVPSPPSTYFQIVAEITLQEPSVERIGKLISQDPAVTAKVLQLANSAALGLQVEIVEPAQAIPYFGLDTTASLVLMAHSFSFFDEEKLAGFSVNSLWAHSALAGRLARKLATLQGSGQELAGEAFTAGLLHDIGKLLFAANLPEQFGKAVTLARQQQLTFREAERQVFGASHDEIGGCLLALWGLPKPIVEAVALHHHPCTLATHGFTPLTAAHVANSFARQAAADSSGGTPEPVDQKHLKRAGLEKRLAEWQSKCLD